MKDFINNGVKFDESQAEIIKANISNSDEVLKSEQEVSLEEAVTKGEVDVISIDDINETYNNEFYKSEDVKKIEANMDALIEKGESDHLTEEEFAELEKAMADIKKLERKAIAVPKGDTHTYREVYVMAQEEGEEGEED